MEVDQWLESNLSLYVALLLRRFHLLQRGVVAVHIGLMMLGVVQLHDLAADGWLEGAIVICDAHNST